MPRDVYYYERNPNEALKDFEDSKAIHLELLKKLASIKDKSEYKEMYLGLENSIEEFQKYHGDMIFAISNLEDLKDNDKATFEEINIQKDRNKKKLIESLQELLSIDTKIKEIQKDMVKGAAVEKEIESVQVLKEREEPREEYIKKNQKIQNELNKALVDLNFTRQQLNFLMNNIMEMEDSPLKKRLLGIDTK